MNMTATETEVGTDTQKNTPLPSELKTLETEWFKELIFRGDLESFQRYVKAEVVQWDGKLGPVAGKKYKIYTANNYYAIIARTKEGVVGDDGYLGCVVSNRTPRPGEDWTRGRDLPDGAFTKETWDKIVRAIAAYELLPMSELFSTTNEADGFVTVRNEKVYNNQKGKFEYRPEQIPKQA